jgi:hypothetical protein
VEVPRGGGEPGVTQEALDPTGVCLAGDERAGAVTQSVEAELPETGGGRGALEASAECGAVDRAPEPGAEHVVVRAGEVLAAGETSECLGGRIRNGDEPRLPALRWAFRTVAQRTVDHEPALTQMDVLPAQRK